MDAEPCQHVWNSLLFRRGKAPIIVDWCIHCGQTRPGYKPARQTDG